MKLENFSEVGKLVKEREYVQELLRIASMDMLRVRLFDQDVRPDLVYRLVPEMKLVFNQQIDIIDEKLAKLGVVIESDNVGGFDVT